MSFDIESAKPENAGFDLSSAKVTTGPTKRGMTPTQTKKSKIEHAKEVFKAEPWYNQQMISAGNQLVGAGRRVKQLINKSDSPKGREVQALIDADSPYSNATYSTPNGFVGAALPYLAAAPLGAEALLAKTVGGGIAGTMAVGGAYGGLATPVETGGSGIENTLWGMGGGAIGHGLQKGIAKGWNAATGKLDPLFVKAKQAAERMGVPLSAGDLFGGTARFVENRLEGLPLNGRREFMSQQGNALENATKGVADKFRQNAGLNTEPEIAMAESLRRQYGANKVDASKLYKVVDETAKQQKAGTIKLDNTHKAISEAVADYPELFGTIGNSKTRDTFNSLLAETGDLPKMAFPELQKLRKLVGAELASAKKKQFNGDSGASDAVKHYGNLFKAIVTDQEAWAKNKGGPVLQSLNEANKYFQKNVIPYREDAAIRKQLDPNANPEALLGMLSPDKFHTTPKIVEMMDESGKKAAQQAWVERALRRSTDPARENMSSFQLIKGLDMGRSGDKVFTQSQKGLLGDLTLTAKTASRAAKVPPDPPTGQRNQWLNAAMLPLLGAGAGATYGGVSDGGSIAGGATGGGVGGLVALGAMLASAKGMNTATKSKVLQNYLAANPEIAGTKEWQRLIGLFPRQASAGLLSNNKRREVQQSEVEY